MITEHYPFKLMPLPYEYQDLEPYIDTQTVTIHHSKHLKTYVDNLNKALTGYPMYYNWPLEKLIKNVNVMPQKIQTDIKNNAGGVYKHNMYFKGMSPRSIKEINGSSSGPLKEAIIARFGSIENFRDSLKTAAMGQFGSGWAWLVSNRFGKIGIVSTANQDTVLTMNLCPIILVDVWEHAYYLKYKNKRGDYFDNWFKIINWPQAEKNYISCTQSNPVLR